MKKLLIAVICTLTLCVGCTQKNTAYQAKTYVSEDEKKEVKKSKEMTDKTVRLKETKEYVFARTENYKGYDYFQFNMELKAFSKKYKVDFSSVKNKVVYTLYYDGKKIDAYSTSAVQLTKEEKKLSKLYYNDGEFKIKHQDLSKVKVYTVTLNFDGKIVRIDIKNKYYK